MKLKIDGRPKTRETWELAQLAIDDVDLQAGGGFTARFDLHVE